MRCHLDASPYSRFAILERVSPATTVYVFSRSATLGDGEAEIGVSARGAVDDPPATTSEKSAFFFSALWSLSLSKTLSSRPIVYLTEGGAPSGSHEPFRLLLTGPESEQRVTAPGSSRCRPCPRTWLSRSRCLCEPRARPRPGRRSRSAY